MTTSDDDPRLAGQEQPLAETTHAEPLAGDPLTDAPYAPVAEEQPPARWPLAILAAVGAALVGVVLWAIVYVKWEREFVAVLIGLTVGWLVRTVSRRSTIAARVAATLITLAAVVLGIVVADVAWGADRSDGDFMTILKDYLPNTVEAITGRAWQSHLIFGAALVLAWLSAGPQKEKPKKQRASASTLPSAQQDAPRQDDSQLPPG